MRLGKVIVGHGYVVDLDNQDMVDHAREALYEDIMSMVKYDEVSHCISIIKNSKGLSENDIPEFLMEGDN